MLHLFRTLMLFYYFLKARFRVLMLGLLRLRLAVCKFCFILSSSLYNTIMKEIKLFVNSNYYDL